MTSSIHLLYVVVALLSPHYAWTPTTALAYSPGQIWKSKNRIRLPSLSLSFPRWLQTAECWSSPPPSDDGDKNTVAGRCASDILGLFGGAEQRKNISVTRADDLLSCIRFLVPPEKEVKLKLSSQKVTSGDCSRERIFKLIREPPAAVAELARKSVEWGGEPQALLAELDSALFEVPDFQGSRADKCTLTKYDCAKRFAKQEINSYLAFLFEAIVTLAPSAGLNVSLNRYDLFHGHMFTAHDTGRLGILFHSREYPEFDKNGFPLNLGFCQTGSFVPYDQSMNLRNIVWLAPMPSCTDHVCSSSWTAPGALFILDAKPDGIVFHELVSEWVDAVRTVYESDLGKTVIDVNYFDVGDENHIFLT